jgi:hypothetical protein
MKKYFVRFEWPEWTVNEYVFRAGSKESAIAKAAAWHMRGRESQGHAVWSAYELPSNPHTLEALQVSVRELENE